MATIGKYNIPNHYKGDTFDGLSFLYKYTDDLTPIDLTGATIKVQFRRNNKKGILAKELTLGDGLTMVDATLGNFQIDAFVIDWEADTYYYDIETTFSATNIKTYVMGTIKIIQDTTY